MTPPSARLTSSCRRNRFCRRPRRPAMIIRLRIPILSTLEQPAPGRRVIMNRLWVAAALLVLAGCAKSYDPVVEPEPATKADDPWVIKDLSSRMKLGSAEKHSLLADFGATRSTVVLNEAETAATPVCIRAHRYSVEFPYRFGCLNSNFAWKNMRMRINYSHFFIFSDIFKNIILLFFLLPALQYFLQFFLLLFSCRKEDRNLSPYRQKSLRKSSVQNRR